MVTQGYSHLYSFELQTQDYTYVLFEITACRFGRMFSGVFILILGHSSHTILTTDFVLFIK